MMFSHTVYVVFPSKNMHSLELHGNLQMLFRSQRMLMKAEVRLFAQFLHTLRSSQVAEVQKSLEFWLSVQQFSNEKSSSIDSWSI